MKNIGFLSFGFWNRGVGSRVRSAADSLTQAVEIAVAADEVGIDGAYFRVHHFAEQQSSPFPLLAAIAARTTHLEVGTGVIDMRYESPLYFAEQAASLDLIAGGRVHLGIGRGSPEAADRGYQHFGHAPAPGKEAGEMAREHTRQALAAVRGVGIAAPNLEQSITRDLLPVSPQSPTVHERISWGAGNRDTAVWAAENGMGLMSSTVIIDDAVTSFSALQAEQIDAFTNAWRSYGWPWRPRITVVRSIVPIVDDESHFYFGTGSEDRDGAGILDGTAFRYGGSYIGSPEDLVNRLRDDVALAAADTVLVTIPSQLGVDFNTRQLAAVHAIGRELGWNDEKTGKETP